MIFFKKKIYVVVSSKIQTHGPMRRINEQPVYFCVLKVFLIFLKFVLYFFFNQK